MFRGDKAFLSNFADLDPWGGIEGPGGIVFPTLEHAYQASKSSLSNDWLRILACKTPGQSRRVGKTLSIRSDWNAVKLDVMRELVHKKFSIPHFRRLLDAVEADQLIEINTWGDTFWGVTTQGVGQNWLGRILREEQSRQGSESPASTR